MSAPGSTPSTHSTTDGLIGQLNVQVQQQQQSSQLLASAVNALEASNTAQGSAATASPSATASPLAPVALSTPAVFAKAAFTMNGTWQMLSIPQIPVSATWIYASLDYQNQGSTNGGTNNARQSMTVQADASAAQIVISRSNGVSGNYENDGAYAIWIPVSNSSLMYNWSDPISFFTFTVLFYS